MGAKSFLIAVLGFSAGVSSVLVYDRFSSEHVERRNAAKADDPGYREAWRALERDSSEFVRAFGGNISAIKMDGESTTCYFFYKTSGMLYDGRDNLYCLEKDSGYPIKKM